MKKNIILTSLLFLYFNLFSISPLLELCNLSLEHNLEVQSQRNNLDSTLKNKKLNFTGFMPQVSIYSKAYYHQDGIEFTEPEYAGFEVSVSQFLPWGLTVYLEPEFLWIKNDSEKDEYIKQHILSLDISQSLLPAAFYFGRKNPYFSIPENQVQIADYNLCIREYSILDSILNSIINLRINDRNTKLAELNLCLCEKKYNAALLLEQKGNINKVVFFQQQQKLMEAKNNLNNLLDSKKSLIQDLQSLCGFTLSVEELELLFEDLYRSEDLFLEFSDNFEFWNYEYYVNLRRQEQKLNYENMKSEYLINKENYAPKLIASVECDYSSDTNHSFEVSLGFDLSNTLNKNKLQLKKKFKNNESLYLEESKQNEQFYKSKIDSYKSRFVKLMDENQSLESEVENMKKIYSDYNELYIQNKCSEVDFLEVKNTCFQLMYRYENNKDLINYYELLLNMELSR